MSLLMTRRTALISAAATTAVFALPSRSRAAAAHEVMMLTKSPDDPALRNIFLPRLLVVEPGDTVNFVPTEKTHNSASIRSMIPEGAETWKGKVNQEIEVTLTVPGFYGYECTPHHAMGMVGLVVVKGDGMMENVEAAKAAKLRGKGADVFAEIWAEVDGLGLQA